MICALPSTGKQVRCHLLATMRRRMSTYPVHVSTEGQYSPSMDDLVKRIPLLAAQQDDALGASGAGVS